jgi:hypothetical protein
MTERILGESGSPRRRRFLVLPVLLTAAFALFWIAGAQAVHDTGDFELGPTPTAPEANITNILGNATDEGPDWADIFDANGDVVSLFGGHAAAFIQDESSAAGATDPTTFSGFGTSNKNNDAISTADCENRDPPLTGSDCAPWGWAGGNIPPKDDLSNVYAYEVIDDNDDLIIYAGLERADPSGDSHLDLEFFQDQVSLVDPGDEFAGVRTVDDVILSMDFLRGGAIGSVTVRAWDGDEYVQVGLAAGEGCNSADTVCAFNNGDDIDGGPWPNIDSHGDVITTLEQNAFTEVGVNLTELIGASPCLSTFMGKTRSSASFTAELKDFAGPHNFDVCAPATTLSVSPTTSTVRSGGNVSLTFSEANTGNEVLLNPGVVATFSGTAGTGCTAVHASPNGDTNADGKLDPGETWTFTCTLTNVTVGGTVSAYAFGTGELSGKLITGQDPCPAGATCDANERTSMTITVIHPATSLRKTAQATIVYTFREKNIGDDPLSNVSVTDSNGCATVNAVLQPGETFNIGDLNDNGLLDPGAGGNGETWTFTCTLTTTDGADIPTRTNTGIGNATDSLGGAVPNGPTTDEQDSVTVTLTHAAPN